MTEQVVEEQPSVAAFSMQGFRTPKQERIYFQFVTRALELLQAEILLRQLGNTAEFDQIAWEKKILKVFKALKMMEKHKSEEPYLSKSFQELTAHLIEKRKLNESNLMKSTTKSDFSRFSLFEQMQAFDSIWQNPRG